MDQVTIQSAEALLAAKTFNMGNTRVSVREMDGVVYSELRLHGKRIARYFPADHKLILYDVGWQTVTTKDRLNGILQIAGLNARIYQQGLIFDGIVPLEVLTPGEASNFTVPSRLPVPSREPEPGPGAGTGGVNCSLTLTGSNYESLCLRGRHL